MTKSSHDIMFPTETDLSRGVDGWVLLPRVCSEDFYGKKVRVTVEVIDDPMQTTLPIGDHIPEKREATSLIIDTCLQCGAGIEACSWCMESARHLGEDDEIACDKHKPYLIGLSLVKAEEMEENDSDELERLYEEKDIGCYMPGVDGCSCDPWR